MDQEAGESADVLLLLREIFFNMVGEYTGYW